MSMENKGNNLSENILATRDYFAAEIMKTFLANQGRRRRMTPLSRLKWWLGGTGWCKGWRVDFDYNMEQISKHSYECADMMMVARGFVDVKSLLSSHKCKYCGVTTTQPDEDCYLSPQK